jgi:hypothetical protein
LVRENHLFSAHQPIEVQLFAMALRVAVVAAMVSAAAAEADKVPLTAYAVSL